MGCYSVFDSVQRIAQKHGTHDPFRIIGESKDMKLWVAESFPKDGLKGFATIQNRMKYVVVNGFLEPEERRVVAGHELGHIIRHEARLRVCPMRDFEIYEATGKLEREANCFAADLLISDEEALDEIHSRNADFFSVAKALRIPAPFFAFKLFSMAQRGYRMQMPVELDSGFLATKKNI